MGSHTIELLARNGEIWICFWFSRHVGPRRPSWGHLERMSSLCWAKNGVFIWESGPLHLSNLGFHGSGWRPEKFPTKKLFVGSFLGLAWRIHWAILGHVGAMLGPCWAMCDPCWTDVGQRHAKHQSHLSVRWDEVTWEMHFFWKNQTQADKARAVRGLTWELRIFPSLTMFSDARQTPIPPNPGNPSRSWFWEHSLQLKGCCNLVAQWVRVQSGVSNLFH